MTKKRLKNKFLIEQLEQRLLFSADFEPISLDSGETADTVLVGSSVEEFALLPRASSSNDSDTEEHKRQEILFVDSSISDYRQLVDGLLSGHDDGRSIEVVVLDINKDGIMQISETLSKYKDLDAVHIVSHGDDGAIRLGNDWLMKETVDDYADSIEGWREALNSEADILFYGCNLAAGEDGLALLESLTFLTGADVAASDDLTGSAGLGGDWDIEYSSGRIETTVAFSEEMQQTWTGVLPVATFQEGSGYNGALDTWIEEINPTQMHDSDGSIRLDKTTTQEENGLIRFDNIFGYGPGQIPWGSTINNAELTMNLNDTGTGVVELHRMLTGWSGTSTWSSMGNGIQTDDVDSLNLTDAQVNVTTSGNKIFSGPDMMTTVQSWLDPGNNYGWFIMSSGSEDCEFLSSDDGTISNRPLLTVDYTAPTNIIYVDTASDIDDAPDTSTITDLLNDTGADNRVSLREAILAVNNTVNAGTPDEIRFNIAGAGPHTIMVGNIPDGNNGKLPDIDDAVIIDGYTQSGASTNTLSVGNDANLMIELDGTSISGTPDGLHFRSGSDGSTVRGLVINSFSGNGIVLNNTSLNIIEGNYIGTDTTGTGNRGNVLDGLYITNNASDNVIGGTTPEERNIIAFNNSSGIVITINGTDGNTIRGNSIHSNSGLGIDLNNDGPTTNDIGDGDNNENQFMNYPMITSAITNGLDTIMIDGAITDGLAGTNFYIDFYYTVAEGGEGGTHLGSIAVITDGSGNVSFNNVVFNGFAVPDLAYITATATAVSGPDINNTSEFSEDFNATLNIAPTDISISASDIDENIDTTGGASIGTLTSTDPNSGDIFSYSIVGGADQGNFSIGGAGSDELILTAGFLNFEAKSSYEVIVRTTDSGSLTFDKTITVTVNDLNEDPTNIDISANAIDENIDTSGGSSIGTLTSSDPDSGDTFNYSVAGGADQGNFSIGGAGSDELILTAGILNFEAKSSYEVIVRTTDSGGLTFDKTITVTVNDLNEDPTDLSISASTIDENIDTSGGSSIGTLSSTDQDSGDSFTYSVVGGADQGNFSIGGAGFDELVLTAGILNYEAKSSYEVIVRTMDSGGLTFDKTITVTVNDLNEDPTDVSISVSDIDENIDTSGGSSIGTLSSTDQDSGDSFTYSVVGGADQGNFSIGGAGFDELVLTAGILNYEAKSSYEVIVRTMDSGGLTIDKTITVTVNDLNEDPTDVSISVSDIDENIDTSGGSSIGTLSSTDQDSGDSFTYSVVGGADQGNFSIGGAGSDELILTAGILNFEAKSSYEVIVRTTDSGGLTFDKTITVTVNDLNEDPTNIDISANAIDENIDTSGGSSIGTLTSSDPDAVDTFTYSVVGGADQGNFSIGGAGSDELILTAGILNYEAKSSYEVIVRTTDSGSLTFDKTITVTVNDLNEDPTNIDISANAIDENIDTSGGSSIGTLTSSDPDSGDTFNYSVAGGADQGNFSIGGAGSDELILTAGILNFEAKSSYEVIVRTTDSGGLTFDKTITVTVNDLNEDPTDLSISASTIDENIDTSGGSSIGTLTSSDPDSGDTFNYSVAGGADQGNFSIGGAGSDELILTAGILNFEAKSSYEVIVRTTDSGGLTFDKTITVTVNDLNEDPTDLSISASTIDENIDTSGGSSIGTLTSSDPDSGDTFNYSVAGGADQGNFSIGGAGSDELILTAGILNFEAKSSYEVIVRTTDSGGLTFDKTITVTVNDLNEDPTDLSISASTIDENIDTSGGSSIGTLSSTDQDSGDSFTYSVVGGADQGNFSIGGAGFDELVLTAGILNYEAKSSYEVIVRTTDSGGLTFDKTITVTVNDLNEDPTDVSISASTIDENVDTSGGSSIGTLTSTDPDSGDTFTYSIVGGADQADFFISGAGSDELILTAGILNFEAKSSYEVIVRTTDSGNLTFDKTITVTVNNLNENPTDIDISANTIDENIDTTGGTSIGTLTSTDPDSGDTFTYSVVGGADQANFSIGGAGSDELIIDAGVLNFEAKSSYEVIVRTTDSGGLTFDKTIFVTVINANDTPTSIDLDNSSVDENSAGAKIGNLTTGDPDSGDTHTYTVDDGRFEIVGNTLKLRAGQSLDRETEPTVDVVLTSTDSGGLSISRTFTITVINVNEAPTGTNLNAPETFSTGTPLNLTDIVVSDVDSANLTVKLILSDPAAGTLSTATSGSVTSTYNKATGVWKAKGPIADVNALLAGVVFTPDDGFSSDFTITTIVKDGKVHKITGMKNMTYIPVADPPADPDPVDELPEPEPEAPEEPEESASDILPEAPGSSETEGAKDRIRERTAKKPPVTAQAEGIIGRLADQTRSNIRSIMNDISSNYRTLPFELSTTDPQMELFSQELFNDELLIKTYNRMRDSLDILKEETAREIQFDKMVVGSTIAASTGLSVGYVIWLIRSGMLLTSVLASMPAWQIADPLPILSSMRGDDDDDDESLEEILKKSEQKDDNYKEAKENSGD